MLVKTDLHMAGYDGEEAQRLLMQKRMLDVAAAIPGVSAVGYARSAAAQHRGWGFRCVR